MSKYCNPKVGIGIFIFQGSKILLGKRKGSHGEGEWSLPGGHLEPGESFEDCCKREVFEETGIDISSSLNFVDVTNDLFPKEGLHYVTLFFKTSVKDDVVPILMEPEKCEEWRWVEFGWNQEEWLSPLFNPLKQLLSYFGSSWDILNSDNNFDCG